MLFVAFLAAASIFFWASRSWLRVWLTKKTLDELYGLLDWALWAVIVGVVVEEWALIWKGCKFIRLAWAGEYAAALTKTWKHKGELAESVGFIVLTIGLAGELALDPLIETRQKADQLRAENSIAVLRSEAKTAEGRIADAQRDAATAHADAARATAEAAQANERTKSLEVQEANAQRDAEQARLEQKQIEAAVAWRVLRPDQLEALGTSLQKSGGSVTIGWIANDPESFFLALQLSKLFDKVNEIKPGTWTVQPDARSYSHRLIFGVCIPNGASPAINDVRSAFTAANVPFSTDDVPMASFQLNSMTTNGGTPNTDVFIMVGSKKPPI